MFNLTQEDKDNFSRDGVVHLRGVFDPAIMGNLKIAINELISNIGTTLTGYDLEYLGARAFSDEEAAEVGHAKQYDLDLMAGLLRFSEEKRLVDDLPKGAPLGNYFVDTGCWTRNAFIKELALQSVMPVLAAQLLEATKVRFYDDQMFAKLPGTSQRTAFHQDYPFFNLQGEKGCVFWAPVDKVDAENGRLSYVRGSHKWGKVFKTSMLIARTPFPGATGDEMPMIEDNPDAYDLVTFDLEPGDVVVHHFKTLHGGGGNLTMDRPRRAMSMRYVGEEMRYQFRSGAANQPHQNHEWNDGDELLEEDFPLVWTSENGALYNHPL